MTKKPVRKPSAPSAAAAAPTHGPHVHSCDAGVAGFVSGPVGRARDEAVGRQAIEDRV